MNLQCQKLCDKANKLREKDLDKSILLWKLIVKKYSKVADVWVSYLELLIEKDLQKNNTISEKTFNTICIAKYETNKSKSKEIHELYKKYENKFNKKKRNNRYAHYRNKNYRISKNIF